MSCQIKFYHQTKVNPLLPHYRCKKCGHIELSNTENDGFDLEPKEYPVCNEKMLGEGHDLDFSLLFGNDGKKMYYLEDLRTTEKGIEEVQKSIHKTYDSVVPQVFESGEISGLVLNPSKEFLKKIIWIDAKQNSLGIEKGILKYSYSIFEKPKYINVLKSMPLELLCDICKSKNIKVDDIQIHGNREIERILSFFEKGKNSLSEEEYGLINQKIEVHLDALFARKAPDGQYNPMNKNTLIILGISEP